MKITVDTNVLIGATFWTGSSKKIIDLVELKKIRLILSQEIIREYSKVLEYDEIKKKILKKNLKIKYPVGKLISLSTMVVPKEKLDVIIDDPDDNIIVECANEGNVNYIISHDKHILKLKYFRGIPIIYPDKFLNIYRRLSN